MNIMNKRLLILIPFSLYLLSCGGKKATMAEEEAESVEEEVDTSLASATSKGDTSVLAEEVPSEVIVKIFAVSDPPKFDGGRMEEKFNAFISKNLVYPEDAKNEEKQGTVRVQFTITANAEVSDINVVSKTIGYGLEEEAIRVIKLSEGRWTPARQRDKPISTRLILPVIFQLY
jgi:protein TonB